MQNTTQNDFLTDCQLAFEANAARIATLADLTEPEVNDKPMSGGWSIAQCIDHAVLAIETYLPYMQAAVARGRARAAKANDRRGRGSFIGRMLLGALDPARDKPMKLKAPAVFRPSDVHIAWRPLLDRAANAHRTLIEITAAAGDLEIDRLRHRTPVSALIRVSLAQALEIHAIHVARHLDQADRVRAQQAASPG